MTNASTETKPKAAHTPGPWLIRKPDNGIYDTDDDIANVVARGPYGLITIAEEVDVADARLIAAAPDMYEALLAAKVVIEMMERPEGMGGRVNAALDKRLAQIDAAIAKARGES